MPVATDDVKALPDAETIVKACKIEVLDKTGAKVTFGSLIDEKTVVVFIRTLSLSYLFHVRFPPSNVMGLRAISSE